MMQYDMAYDSIASDPAQAIAGLCSSRCATEWHACHANCQPKSQALTKYPKTLGQFLVPAGYMLLSHRRQTACPLPTWAVGWLGTACRSVTLTGRTCSCLSRGGSLEASNHTTGSRDKDQACDTAPFAAMPSMSACPAGKPRGPQRQV